MVDSIPVSVAHIVREHSTAVCREHFYSAPDKGYSAVFGQYYIGYKLHLVVSLDGIYQSMDLTKARVNDAGYQKDLKQSGLNNCLLLAEKDLPIGPAANRSVYSRRIELQIPMRRNQHGYRPWPVVFKKARRVEIVFSQLCDQIMLKRNYAKTFAGLRTRIISKIASVPCYSTSIGKTGDPLITLNMHWLLNFNR